MNWFMNLWSVRGFGHDYFKEVCDKLNHHRRKYELVRLHKFLWGNLVCAFYLPMSILGPS